jgi:CheY-like chemotaxis protein
MATLKTRPPVRHARAAQARDPKAPASALRILVVDDNVDSALTLAALLSMYGHEVCTAHDGLNALEEMSRFKPDVAILDIGMPKMNGYSVAQHIRSSSEAQPLLIAVTGWGQEEDRRRSKAAGFDHHLVKPVDPAALAALLSSRPMSSTLH